MKDELIAKIEALDCWSVPNLALRDLVRRSDVLEAIRSAREAAAPKRPRRSVKYDVVNYDEGDESP